MRLAPDDATLQGNLDCRELVAGSTLHLPVTVPEALLSVGDGHAAQGDGEVSGTAIECPVEATPTLDLLDDVHALALRTPVAHTPAGWVARPAARGTAAGAWRCGPRTSGRHTRHLACRR